jgi:hypothetical protein
MYMVSIQGGASESINLLAVCSVRLTMDLTNRANYCIVDPVMTECKGPHHDFDDFTTFTTSTSRLAN